MPSLHTPLQTLYACWNTLSDVPVDEEQCLTVDFMDHLAGTHVEDVWRALEAQNPRFIVGEIMQGHRVDLDEVRSLARSTYAALVVQNTAVVVALLNALEPDVKKPAGLSWDAFIIHRIARDFEAGEEGCVAVNLYRQSILQAEQACYVPMESAQGRHVHRGMSRDHV